MTKLRNIVGIAFVAMSLLTGLAVTSATAQQVSLELEQSSNDKETKT